MKLLYWNSNFQPVNQLDYSENSMNPTDRLQRTFDIPTVDLNIEPNKLSLVGQKSFSIFYSIIERTERTAFSLFVLSQLTDKF